MRRRKSWRHPRLIFGAGYRKGDSNLSISANGKGIPTGVLLSFYRDRVVNAKRRVPLVVTVNTFQNSLNAETNSYGYCICFCIFGDRNYINDCALKIFLDRSGNTR